MAGGFRSHVSGMEGADVTLATQPWSQAAASGGTSAGLGRTLGRGPRSTPVIPKALAPLLWLCLALCSLPRRPYLLSRLHLLGRRIPGNRSPMPAQFPAPRCPLGASRAAGDWRGARCTSRALPARLCIPSSPVRRLLEHRPEHCPSRECRSRAAGGLSRTRASVSRRWDSGCSDGAGVPGSP